MVESSVALTGDKHELANSDPTALTTAVVQREILHLAERVDLRIDGVVETTTTRLDAIDKATSVFSENLNRVPTALQEAISHLKEYHGERFEGVERQFNDLRLSIDKSERVTNLAVTAALEAAGRITKAQSDSFALSIDKSEKAMAKQIDQIMELLQQATSAANDKNDDLKSRLTRIEGQALGRVDQKSEQNWGSSFIVSIIAVVIAAIAILSRFWTGR